MRQIKLCAIKDGSIEDNLKELGYSNRICTKLRKKMGLITLNGEAVRIVDSICVGQEFFILVEENKVEKIEKYDFPIEIVYEDEDLAVINKPEGLAVINTRVHYGKSLQNALASIWGDFVYRPVNRLDKDTSGLMIIAKNQLAHSKLNMKHIKRKYLALCEGELKGSGCIDVPIGRKEGSIIERCVLENGKDAKTKYRVLKNYSSYTLVELELETGRTHQIRVHMQSINHPLLGDFLYNPNYKVTTILDNGFRLGRQALHSYYLEFIHPISNAKIVLKSIPDFEQPKVHMF